MLRGPMSSSQSLIKALAQRGQALRTQLHGRGLPARRPFSMSSNPSTLTESMSAHPWWTFFWGTTAGYFIAMYTERTIYKDEFVRDKRHKPTTTGAVTGLPSAK